jgi:hypothetical protein
MTLLATTIVAAQQTPTPAGTATGQKIGTIIKEAVSTAFPAVPQILSVIWPNGDGNKKKAEAEQALKAKETELKQHAADRAKAAVKPLGSLSAELATVEKFASAATKASPNIIAMQTLLSSSPAPADLLTRLKEEWQIASGFLTPLATVTDNDIKVISESSIRVQVQALREANRTLVVRINNRVKPDDIKNVDIPSLREYLSALAELLNGINATANVELDMLQQEVAGVVAWANNQLGVPATSRLNKDLMNTSKASIEKAKVLLARSPK